MLGCISLALDMDRFSAHFCHGHLPVAFVFSVPGEEESRLSRPVAGDTGENLESALVLLQSARPAIFRSVHRYDYRITNAFTEPTAVGLGHSASEAKDSRIRDPRNVVRILQELEGCNLVILCGRKAQLLLKPISEGGKTVVAAWHIGNKGLNCKFKLKEIRYTSTSSARRMQRVDLWAKDVLSALDPEESG